jgi:hypothetical protein
MAGGMFTTQGAQVPLTRDGCCDNCTSLYSAITLFGAAAAAVGAAAGDAPQPAQAAQVQGA